jgi:hypothetical protein
MVMLYGLLIMTGNPKRMPFEVILASHQVALDRQAMGGV